MWLNGTLLDSYHHLLCSKPFWESCRFVIFIKLIVYYFLLQNCHWIYLWSSEDIANIRPHCFLELHALISLDLNFVLWRWWFFHTYFVPFTLLLNNSNFKQLELEEKYQRCVLFCFYHDLIFFFVCIPMPLPYLYCLLHFSILLLSSVIIIIQLWAHYHVITNRI